MHRQSEMSGRLALINSRVSNVSGFARGSPGPATPIIDCFPYYEINSRAFCSASAGERIRVERPGHFVSVS